MAPALIIGLCGLSENKRPQYVLSNMLTMLVEQNKADQGNDRTAMHLIVDLF